MPQQVPPIMMLRSFLTVASGYVLCLVALTVIMVALGYGFFPQFAEFLELDQAAQENIMANNPETAVPRSLFLMTVALTSVACMAIGWIVVRTAPFAHYPHAIFLAVLMFIYFLQIAIADPAPKKSMTLVYMVAFPVAILIGARIATASTSDFDNPESND